MVRLPRTLLPLDRVAWQASAEPNGMLPAEIEQMNPAGTEPHDPLTKKALPDSSTIWNELTGTSRVPKLPRTHWETF